jgi:ribose 5-phosphate isomerase B
MKIALGSDHRGTEVRLHLEEFLRQEGHEVIVMRGDESDANGKSCDYPDVAFPIGTQVSAGAIDRGILICGSGIGMSIAANKVDGVRAALVHDDIGAQMSRQHNDANVLCLSADMLGMRIIDRLVKTWLETPFDGGRHARRVKKIGSIEQGEDPRQIAEPDSTTA